MSISTLYFSYAHIINIIAYWTCSVGHLLFYSVCFVDHLISDRSHTVAQHAEEQYLPSVLYDLSIESARPGRKFYDAIEFNKILQ